MSATNSGELVIPMMAGVMLTSLLSGFLLKRTGYKIWLLIGPPIAALGLFLMSTLHSGSSALDAIIFLIITGAGLGCVMANFIVAAQNVSAKKDMGVVTSSMSLFRSIGGTVGVAALGALINGQMAVELGRNLAPGVLQTLPTTDANSVGQLLLISSGLPAPILDGIRLSLSNSITYAFLIGAVIVLVALVVSALVRSVPLKSADEYHEAEVVTNEPPTTMVDPLKVEAAQKAGKEGR